MKKLSFVEAVKSGKDFRCVEGGEIFRNHCPETLRTNNDELMIFCKDWLDKEFEIIEVKKELTASEIEEAFEYAWVNSDRIDIMKEKLLKKLGFK